MHTIEYYWIVGGDSDGENHQNLYVWSQRNFNFLCHTTKDHWGILNGTGPWSDDEQVLKRVLGRSKRDGELKYDPCRHTPRARWKSPSLCVSLFQEVNLHNFPVSFSTVQPRMWVGDGAHKNPPASTALQSLLRLEKYWFNQHHWGF